MTKTNFIQPGALPDVESERQNVLVVDDEDPVRELIAYVLDSHGYRVIRARHSREAMFLHAGFAGTLHLLLTDICMHPFESGFDLARVMHRDRPDLRIIYASGFVEPDQLRREVEQFGALFLPKPFTPAALLECVQRSLRTASPA